MITEYYRLRAEELHNKLMQIRQFKIKHNLSFGVFAEDLLRNFIRESLPSKYKVTQGFVANNNEISPQCDVIIYNAMDYTPLFSTANMDVIPAEAAVAVIEIKIRINREGFNTTLANFRQLQNLGIRNKYLFIYSSCSWKTIESYFWDKKSNCVDFNQLCVGAEKYDHGNYDELPEAILGLKHGNEFLLKKDYVITDNRDMKGYTSLIFDDTMGRAISCLQTFLECLMEITGTKYTDSTGYAYKINRYEGIPLFEM